MAQEPTATDAPDGKSQPKAKQTDRSSTHVRSIRHFPVTMFAGILALLASGMAWQKASDVFGAPTLLYKLIFGFAIGYTVAVLTLYGVKILRHPSTLGQDLRHPIRGSFLAAAPLGLLLLVELFTPYQNGIVTAIWIFAVVVSIFLSAVILNQWLDARYRPYEITPAWFIPSVGLLIAPITGASLGFEDFSWMMFAVGIMFWVLLYPLTLHRLLFRRPMSPALMPYMFLLIAPPSLAAVAVTRLNADYMDGLAKALLGVALLTTAFFLPRWKRFLKAPFGMPWWCCSFAMGFLSVGCLYYAEQTGGWLSHWLAIATLTVASIATLIVTILTLRAFATGHLFRAPKS